MSYQNAQFKNSGNDEGDVLNFFNNQLRNLVQKNGGDNTFSIVCENCHDKDYPVPMKTKTKLHLTHSAHTISQIEKGFITVDLAFKLKFNQPLDKRNFFVWNGEAAGAKKSQIEDSDIADIDNIDLACTGLDYIFVGFKDAVEIISDLKFWVDGRLVDNYNQQEMIKESFAYNSIRPKDAKTSSPNSHSLWESVCCMSPNVAGVYIPLAKFALEKEVPVKMELTIPFTDQLALQAWRLYPNRILGEMEEEVQFCLDALVWCQLQPKSVGEIKKFWEYDSKYYYDAPWLPITNHFTQINQDAIIVKKHKLEIIDNKLLVKNDDAGFSDDEFTLKEEDDDEDELALFSLEDRIQGVGGMAIPNRPNRFRKYIGLKDANTVCLSYVLGVNRLEVVQGSAKVVECKTNCAGFGVKPQVIEGILQGLHEPVIIPAQELSKYQFEMTPVNNSFTMNKSIPLRNATNITLMFPMHENDCTVYKNIMFDGVRLTVNKKVYPETEFKHTWGGRFVQYQLMANELDGCIEATQEFMESISRPLNNVYDYDFESNGRLTLCPFDNTSFGINFQLERGNSGYVFDGVDTGSHAISVEFIGHPHSTSGVNNPYIYADLKVTGDKGIVVDATKKSRPNPEMWICSDTYWTWSVEDGVKYYPRGIPAGYD